MPSNYVLFSGESESWIEYLGANHGRLKGTRMSDQFESLGTEGDIELRRSAHGAVVIDHAQRRYAWVYVHPGGHKLRWPSVLGGELKPGIALLRLATFDSQQHFELVKVDLTSGAVSH